MLELASEISNPDLMLALNGIINHEQLEAFTDSIRSLPQGKIELILSAGQETIDPETGEIWQAHEELRYLPKGLDSSRAEAAHRFAIDRDSPQGRRIASYVMSLTDGQINEYVYDGETAGREQPNPYAGFTKGLKIIFGDLIDRPNFTLDQV